VTGWLLVGCIIVAILILCAIAFEAGRASR
jgi:hypothetical protein